MQAGTCSIVCYKMKFVTIILLMALGLLQYRLWLGSGSQTELHHLQQEKQAIIDSNQVLQERNNALASEILDLKYGMDAIEERARSELGMIKKGEIFYHVVNKTHLDNLRMQQNK